MSIKKDWKEFTVGIFQLREGSVCSHQDWLSYFLKLLLIKYLSDTADAKSNKIAKYFSQMPNETHWNNFVKASNLGKALDEAIKKIGNTNPKLKDVFGESTFHRIPERSLLAMLSKFNEIKLDKAIFTLSSNYAVIAEDAIDLAANDEKDGGEYFTPKGINKLLVKLLSSKERMTIHDPVCGTGGLFIECAKYLTEINEDFSTLQFFGQELNKQVYEICQINLLLHGLENFEIENGDTLRDPKFIKENKLKHFDRVIANPPFNLNDWGYGEVNKEDKFDRFRYGLPPKKNGDFAFIQHIVATLEDTSGKGVMIVSPGVLFRAGVEQEIRKRILESDIIEAAIGVSTNLLYNTSSPPAILIFNRKKRENRKGKVLIIDASKEYQKLDRGQNTLDDENVNKIALIYKNFEDVEKVAKVVTLEEMEANDYQLNANRYIKPPRNKIVIQQEFEKLSQLELQRSQLEIKMNQCLQDLGINL
jgi:type I restriction enzyme M protein